jgi:hypothetical protein
VTRHGRAAVLLGGSWLALLQACASLPAPEPSPEVPAIVISGLEIRNELSYPVTDVMISVPTTGAFAGCGNLLPRSQCSNRFEHIDYRANPVVISWKEHGQPHETEEFRIEQPEGVAPGEAFRVQVILFAPGEAGARLVPANEE